MIESVIFEGDGLDQYITWQTEDRKTLKKTNQLIKDIRRNGEREGIGLIMADPQRLITSDFLRNIGK